CIGAQHWPDLYYLTGWSGYPKDNRIRAVLWGVWGLPNRDSRWPPCRREPQPSIVRAMARLSRRALRLYLGIGKRTCRPWVASRTVTRRIRTAQRIYRTDNRAASLSPEKLSPGGLGGHRGRKCRFVRLLPPSRRWRRSRCLI